MKLAFHHPLLPRYVKGTEPMHPADDLCAQLRQTLLEKASERRQEASQAEQGLYHMGPPEQLRNAAEQLEQMAANLWPAPLSNACARLCEAQGDFNQCIHISRRETLLINRLDFKAMPADQYFDRLVG